MIFLSGDTPIEEEEDDDDVFCVGQLSFGEGVFQTQLSTIVHDRLPVPNRIVLKLK